MLPLETFCELIGAKYSFDKKSKLYLISFSNHKAKFKANSNMAWIDGKYVNIGSNTNIFKGSLVVPVGNLLKYFKINNRWDSKTHLLTLNDNRILKPSVIGDFEKARHDYFIYDAFNLVSYKINDINNTNSQLEITAKNILGVEIPAGNEDIHPVYIYKNSASWEPISRPQRPRPLVKKDATIKIVDGNYMSLKDLKYIVVVARVWNGKFGEKPWYKDSR